MENRQIDLSIFSTLKSSEALIPISGSSTSGNTARVRHYTREQIQRILDNGTLEERQQLSYSMFLANGIYTRLIYFYATLLMYAGVLIPNSYPEPSKLSEKSNQKKYYAALQYIDNMKLQPLLANISLRVLINGAFYGVVNDLSKDNFSLVELPYEYCRTRYKDNNGQDLVEFNVSYFNTLNNVSIQEQVLKAYPKFIVRYYKKWMEGKVSSSWALLPAELGIVFQFFDNLGPLFVSMVPALLDYDDTIATDRKRDEDEISKIIVQHVPHLNDGQLLFEPPEAAEMHRGAVHMMAGNDNVSVLTTYADVDSIISKTTNDSASNTIKRMLQNVYTQAGVSGELFAATSSSAMPFSLQKDIALMMVLSKQYSTFISKCLTDLFGNRNFVFKYEILPISYENTSDYITDSFKLAQSGYSFIVPALALGLTQSDLVNIKHLENNVLKLDKVLVPLQSAYTQSSDTGEAGRPEVAVEDQSPQTQKNKTAIDNQGGSV